MHPVGEKLDLDSFSGLLPLFPLPDVVHFPCALLPLHIFEPRYRAMIRDAARGERIIGMVKLRPGWEADYQGSPPVHTVACLGTMIETHPLPDGRFNIVLCGVKRAKIGDLVQERPYRIARVELLDDASTEGREPRAITLKERLIRRVRALPSALLKHRRLALALEKLDAPLGCSTDLVADSLRIAPDLKQRLLEELDPIARAERLIEAVDHELVLAAGQLGPTGRAPEPSLN